jgi:hypothetical protein
VILDLLPAGEPTILAGKARDLGGLQVHLLHEAAQREGRCLFIDGAKTLNPYDYADYNLLQGLPADYGVQKILSTRAMTPFQVHNLVTSKLAQKLHEAPTSCVIVSRFEAQLLKTEDVQPWEQVSYIHYDLNYLRRLAKRHGVAILVTLDWPALQRPGLEHFHAAVLATKVRRIHVEQTLHGWTLHDEDGRLLHESPRRTLTLDDYLEPVFPVPLVPAPPLEDVVAVEA